MADNSDATPATDVPEDELLYPRDEGNEEEVEEEDDEEKDSTEESGSEGKTE